MLKPNHQCFKQPTGAESWKQKSAFLKSIFPLNSLSSNESFDLIAFASTKGERWKKYSFSYPDAELRQGTRYPWAIDVVADYDKYISASFFGVGLQNTVSRNSQ